MKPKQRYCKNCGAPLEHSYNHQCPCCKTLYDFNEPEDKVIEVKPEDLVNVELRSVERGYDRNTIILIFDGYKCPMPKVYEYNSKNNNYVSRIQEYVNPPKCGFCVELDMYDIKEYGLGYILHAVMNTGVRHNEFDRIRNQIMTNQDLKLHMFRLGRC